MSKDDEITFVRCGTTAGPFVMKLVKKWSPNGYDRAVDLFSRGFYDDTHFFRVAPGFLVQFGITYSDDQELRKFAQSTIPDDPKPDPPIPFHEGTVSFAGGGDDSRTSQLFISYGSAKSLGTQKWETPIGEVVEGMENVRNFYSEYGDMPPWGHGPEMEPISIQGRKYIDENFPLVSRFDKCTVFREHDFIGSVDKDKREDENAEEAPKFVRFVPEEGKDVPAAKIGLDSDSFMPKSIRLGLASASEQTYFAAAGVSFAVLSVLCFCIISRRSRKSKQAHGKKN